MNDRFKFRVWDIQKDEIKYDVLADFEFYLRYNEIFDVMQCTGLKDKNGKLIYEGDVVEFYSQSLLDALSRKGLARRVGQVVWNDEFLKFDVIVGSHAVPDLCKETDDNNFEVIGNIYENKELLNESISNS